MWGAKTQIANSLSVAGTELFSSVFTLNPGESVHIQVEADFPASPTDNLDWKLYTTLDDATENWDDTPLSYFQIDNGADPNAVSIITGGFYKARLGFIRSGASDTITVNAWIRKDGVSV